MVETRVPAEKEKEEDDKFDVEVIASNLAHRRNAATIARNSKPTEGEEPAGRIMRADTAVKVQNNRVAKAFKEDDDLFGHIERLAEEEDELEIMGRAKNHDEMEDNNVRGDTFVRNFDDLIRGQEEIGPLAANYRISANSSGTRAGPGSLADRYKKVRQSTNIEETTSTTQQSEKQMKALMGLGTTEGSNDGTSSDGIESGLGSRAVGTKKNANTSSSDGDEGSGSRSNRKGSKPRNK